MTKATRYLRGFVTIGFLAYFVGAGFMLGALAPLSKEDFTGAGICGIFGVLFVAIGLMQMHEERYHKKS